MYKRRTLHISYIFPAIVLLILFGSCSHREIKAVSNRENLDSLITVYENEFAKDSANYINAMNLGEVYFKKARRSLEDYGERSYWWYIRTWAQKDVYLNAARVLEKATQLVKEKSLPYEYLAKIYYDLYMVQASDDMAAGKTFMWRYTDRTNLARAIGFCRQAIARSHDNTEMYVLMALMSMRMDEGIIYGWNDSLNYYFGEALRTQGLAQDLQRLSSKADKYRLMLKDSKHLHLKDDISYLGLLDLCGELSKSYDTVASIYERMPVFAKAYYLLGLGVLWKTDLERSLDIIEKACAVNPSSLLGLEYLVAAKAYADEPEQALKYYKEWLALSPVDSFPFGGYQLPNGTCKSQLREYELSLVDTSAYLLHFYARQHDLGRANEYLTRLLANDSFTERNYLKLIDRSLENSASVKQEFGFPSAVFVKEIQNMQVKLCERGIQRFPNSVELRMTLAGFYIQSGRIDDAFELLKKTIELCGENIAGNEITRHYEDFPKEKAEELFSYALKHNVTPEHIYHAMAQHYFMVGDNKKAVELGETVLRINPEYYPIYYDMIYYYCIDSQYEKALEMSDRIKKMFEQWNYRHIPLDYYHSRLEIFNRFKKCEKALELCDEVFQADPGMIEGWFADTFADIQKADSALVLSQAKAGNRVAQYMLSKQKIPWE